jgi:hypothetical protein
MADKHFLDEVGLRFLVSQLMNKMNLKINSRMVNLVDVNSTDDKIPSAKAVYDALIEGLGGITGVSLEVVSELPSEGEPGVIYLIETGTSGIYVQWVYIGGSWIELGTSEVNLDNYWSKDELEPITNADIQEILDEVGLGDEEPEEPEEEEEEEEEEPEEP